MRGLKRGVALIGLRRCVRAIHVGRGRTLREATSGLKVRTFEDIPGLMVIEDFINSEEADRVIYSARTLSMMADDIAKEKLKLTEGKP